MKTKKACPVHQREICDDCRVTAWLESHKGEMVYTCPKCVGSWSAEPNDGEECTCEAEAGAL